MRKKDLIEDAWYYIKYVDYTHPECSFEGPAQYKWYDGEGMYAFSSPLLGCYAKYFRLQDIKRPCAPLPAYVDLLRQSVDPSTIKENRWGSFLG